jgi:EAL and modified HD-GYP domain-containing signal transduction protein
MSDVYIARQPIFGRDMKVYGYELLYRKSERNCFEGTDDDKATATLLDDLFFIEFDELTEGARGFINFSKNLLLEEVPLLLPKDNLIIEILERVDVDEHVLEMCRKFKSRGYILAIDDFIFDNKNRLYEELIEIVDIIKVDFLTSPITEQINLINKHRGHISFLAEKVETHEDYMAAQNMGYSLFQGYFFSRPVMVNAKAIGSFSGNVIAIINALHEPEPDFEGISGRFEADIELSYKLLKLVNSAYYGVKYSITSIHHALVQLGPVELIKWMNIMVIKDIQNVENMELIKLSLIRGKMLSLLADSIKKRKYESDFFLVGMFSAIDLLLNQDMEKIVEKLPLKEEIKNALVGEKNHLRQALDAVIEFEKLNCESVDDYLSSVQSAGFNFMSLYIESLKWQRSLAQY